MLLSPHTASIERWFELLIDRKEHDEAVRVAELLRRHRFYSSLPFGGRILSLRWLVEGGPAMLGKRGMEQRTHLRMKYPGLVKLSRESERIQLRLREMPVHAKEDQLQEQRKLLRELITVANGQENIVREIALRREPARLVFPPQPSLEAIQAGMKKNQAILMFVTTSQGWHAWFIRKSQDEYWPIRSPASVSRGISALLKACGNRDRNSTVNAKDLNENWKPLAKKAWNSIVGKLPSNGWDDLEELVIVPDGPLWYLPFEMLRVPAQQLEDSDEDTSLGSLLRVRYAPVASLSVGDNRGRKEKMKTVVVGGQLFPRESSEYAVEMLAKLKEAFPDIEVVSQKKRAVASAGYTAGTLDRLLVWNDIGKSTGYGWSPAQYDRGLKHSTLIDWIEYPWGAPDQVILPGFHTLAESPVSVAKKGTGYEIFLNACGIMATGTRTILISRWRTGGRAPSILVREFVKELPFRSASESWQRAVDLVRIEKLDAKVEPRVRAPSEITDVTADHPFFWAGYLLLDTGSEPDVEQEANEPPPPAAGDVEEGREEDIEGAAIEAAEEKEVVEDADSNADSKSLDLENVNGENIDGDVQAPTNN